MRTSLGTISLNRDVFIPGEQPSPGNPTPGDDERQGDNPGEPHFTPDPDVTAQKEQVDNEGNEIFPTQPECK